MAAAAFPLAPGTTVLAVTAFGVGFTISPTLIGGFGLVEALVPPAALTEGLTWASTGLGLGVALGSSAAGQVVDAAGARRAFGVTVLAGLLAVVVAHAGRRWLAAAPTVPAVSGLQPTPTGRTAR
jgi:predicted MFS family arabinose efflux permease